MVYRAISLKELSASQLGQPGTLSVSILDLEMEGTGGLVGFSTCFIGCGQIQNLSLVRFRVCPQCQVKIFCMQVTSFKNELTV